MHQQKEIIVINPYQNKKTEVIYSDVEYMTVWKECQL